MVRSATGAVAVAILATASCTPESAAPTAATTTGATRPAVTAPGPPGSAPPDDPAGVGATGSGPTTGVTDSAEPGPAGTGSVPPVTTPTGIPTCGQTTGTTTRHSFPSAVFAPSAKPIQPYLVHTPACYDLDQSRRYPVLYLLHGAQTDETQWADVGVLTTADRLTAAGQIPPMIIVLPDALDAMGDYDGAVPPLDWFVLNELKPRVEAAYRTRTDAAHRAIGGISRGGEWALLIAGRHPDVFSAVGGHSPAVGVPTNPGPQLAGQLAGRGLRIWLDVGGYDSLVTPVRALDQALTARGVNHEFQVGTGGHDRAYWAAMSETYLRWYSAAWADGR